MVKVTNEGKITISAKILEMAKEAVKLIDDSNLRKKYYASAVAMLTFAEEMKANGIVINKNDSLCRVHSFAELADVGSVSYRNLQIDVRVILDGDDVYIPKSHKRNEIIPDIYVFAKLNKNFNYLEFLGFVESDIMPDVEDLKEYYSMPISSLSPMEKLPDLLFTKKPAAKEFDFSDHERVQELFVSYFDDKLSRVEKAFLVRHLFYCPECRKKFLNFYDFELVSKFIQKTPDVLDNHERIKEAVKNVKSAAKKLKEKAGQDADSQENETIEMTLKDDIYTINETESLDEVVNAPSVVEHSLVRDERTPKLFRNKFKRAITGDDELISELRSTMEAAEKEAKSEEIARQKDLAKDLLEKNNEKVGTKKIEIEGYLNDTNAPKKNNVIKLHRETPKAKKAQNGGLKQVAGHMNLKSGAAKVTPSIEPEKKEHPIRKIDLDKNPTDSDDITAEKDENIKVHTVSKFLDTKKKSPKKNGKMISRAAALLIVAGLILGGGYYGVKNYKAHKTQQQVAAVSGELATIEMNTDAQDKKMSSGLQQAIAEGFGDFSSSISVSNLAWEVAPEYTSNQNFINFLQNAGIALQSSVQDALMNIGDEYSAVGDHVKVAFTMSKDLGVKNFQVEETTGSAEIDQTIKDAVLATLKYFNFPEVGKGINDVDFKLLIEF